MKECDVLVAKQYGKWCPEVITASVEKPWILFTIGVKRHILVAKFVEKNLEKLLLMMMYQEQ